MTRADQQARDLLARGDSGGAQQFTAGDLAELANRVARVDEEAIAWAYYTLKDSGVQERDLHSRCMMTRLKLMFGA